MAVLVDEHRLGNPNINPIVNPRESRGHEIRTDEHGGGPLPQRGVGVGGFESRAFTPVDARTPRIAACLSVKGHPFPALDCSSWLSRCSASRLV
eukprot:1192611-Prorocentrum_minimum.AAC.1